MSMMNNSISDSGGDGVDAPIARHKQGRLTCQHDEKNYDGR